MAGGHGEDRQVIEREIGEGLRALLSRLIKQDERKLGSHVYI